MRKDLLRNKHLIAYFILIAGLFLFCAGVFRFYKGEIVKQKWPLRLQRRIEALKEGRKSWQYETSESPLPLKNQLRQ